MAPVHFRTSGALGSCTPAAREDPCPTSGRQQPLTSWARTDKPSLLIVINQEKGGLEVFGTANRA